MIVPILGVKIDKSTSTQTDFFIFLFYTFNWLGESYFLGKERNWKGRKIKEAIFINAHSPRKEISSGKLLNLEKEINVNLIWGFFNHNYGKLQQRSSVAFPFSDTWLYTCMRAYWVYQLWNLIECYVNQDPDEDTSVCRNVEEMYIWQN